MDSNPGSQIPMLLSKYIFYFTQTFLRKNSRDLAFPQTACLTFFFFQALPYVPFCWPWLPLSLICLIYSTLGIHLDITNQGFLTQAMRLISIPQLTSLPVRFGGAGPLAETLSGSNCPDPFEPETLEGRKLQCHQKAIPHPRLWHCEEEILQEYQQPSAFEVSPN